MVKIARKVRKRQKKRQKAAVSRNFFALKITGGSRNSISSWARSSWAGMQNFRALQLFWGHLELFPWFSPCSRLRFSYDLMDALRGIFSHESCRLSILVLKTSGVSWHPRATFETKFAVVGWHRPREIAIPSAYADFIAVTGLVLSEWTGKGSRGPRATKLRNLTRLVAPIS